LEVEYLSIPRKRKKNAQKSPFSGLKTSPKPKNKQDEKANLRMAFERH
jgi:hypothetical protein